MVAPAINTKQALNNSIRKRLKIECDFHATQVISKILIYKIDLFEVAEEANRRNPIFGGTRDLFRLEIS